MGDRAEELLKKRFRIVKLSSPKPFDSSQLLLMNDPKTPPTAFGDPFTKPWKIIRWQSVTGEVFPQTSWWSLIMYASPTWERACIRSHIPDIVGIT